MFKKKKVRIGATVAVVAGLTVGGAWTASADPAAGTYPALAGVGSDTIQDVMDGVATQVTSIGSYDAVDPVTQVAGGTIKTRANGPAFTRPNGSGAGTKALSASYGGLAGNNYQYNNVNIQGQVDFARSSSGPSGTGTALTYIPFAQDAVTYAVNEASDFPRDIQLGSASDPTNKFTLYNIYRCTVTSYINAEGDAVPITPLLPQSGSGTRAFWLSQVGLTESTLPTCVTSLNNTVQEHSGAKLTDPGYIVPFSISQFIAQGNHSLLPTNVVERRFAAQLGSIGGVKPYTISNGNVVQNSSFPVKRLVYNVVATSAITSGSPNLNPALVSAFVGSSSQVCSQASIIRQYGFAPIGNCGATTITAPFAQ